MLSEAATAAATTTAPSGFLLRRLPGDDFVGYEIAQSGEVAGHAKPHVGFDMLIILHNEGVVVTHK